MAKNLARLTTLAAALTLSGCSLIIDGQVTCKTDKDCTSPATCGAEGLCTTLGGQPDAAQPPGEDAGTPDAGPGVLVLAVKIGTNPVAGTDTTVTVTAKNAGATLTTYSGTVKLTASDPKATLPANYTFASADNGVHAFTVRFLTSGSVTVTATDVDQHVNGTDTATVTSGAAVKLELTGIPAGVAAGDQNTLTVRALDVNGNTVTGYTGKVTFTSDDPQAQLPNDFTFTTSDNGTHAFIDGVELRTAGVRAVTGTDTATASITGTESNIIVSSGAVAALGVSGIASPLSAGTPASVTVAAQDAFGNPVTDYLGKIAFTGGGAGAQLPPDYTFLTGDGGTKTFTNAVKLKAIGTQSVTATDTTVLTITGAQTGIQVQRGPAAQLAFTVSPVSVQTTVVISPSVVVQVQDLGGNLVPTATNSVTLTLGTSPAGAVLTGGSAKAAVAGVATFDALSVDKDTTLAEPSYVLHATSGTLIAADSQTFSASSCTGHHAGVGCTGCAPGYQLDGSNNCQDYCTYPSNPCTTPTASSCTGNTLTTYASPGTCTPNGTAPTYHSCAYTPTVTNCTTTSTFCDSGSFTCVDPCVTTPCTGSPDPTACTAAGKRVTTYKIKCTPVNATTRTCATNEPDVVTDCTATQFCDATHLSCIDPCVTTPCTGSADPTSCTGGNTVTTYSLVCNGTDPVTRTCDPHHQVSQVTCTSGQFCDSTHLTCTDPCVTNPCTGSADPTTCTGGNTVTTYSLLCTGSDPVTRTCDPHHQASQVTCTTGLFCDASHLACTDPCTPMPADCTPDPTDCSADAKTLTTYKSVCTGSSPTLHTCANHTTLLATDCTATGKVCYQAACATFNTPVPADLLITEVMCNPNGPAAHKWFEVKNLSSKNLNLAGLIVDQTAGTSATFTLPAATPALLLSKAYFVFGADATPANNGGVTVDYVWPAAFSTSLGTTGDLVIRNGGTPLDEVAWDTTLHPTVQGKSMYLSSQAYAKGTRVTNVPWYWCDSASVYDATDSEKGTPRALNETCGMPVTPTINYCKAQHIDPAVKMGVATWAYGQIWSPGYTDKHTTGNDLYPFLVGQFGYGAAGAVDGTAFTWFDAAFNPGYSTSGNNDEMWYSVTFPAAVTYAWAYRFAFIDPVTLVQGAWTYCDATGTPVTAVAATNNTWASITVNP